MSSVYKYPKGILTTQVLAVSDEPYIQTNRRYPPFPTDLTLQTKNYKITRLESKEQF
jgi:hypothetical protein